LPAVPIHLSLLVAAATRIRLILRGDDAPCVVRPALGGG